MRLTLVCLVLMLFPSWANAEWVEYGPLKNSPEYGPVVTDVEQHLPARHVYRDDDKITWTHEGTHGIASQLRGKYQQPGFYLLNNNAYLLKEPKTTLAAVATKIPRSLRGAVYQLYCIDQQRYWNNEPSYLIDEWVAYLNGSLARRELGIEGRSETLRYLVEMAIYSTCVAQCVEDDGDLKAFLRHMWRQTLLIVDSDVPVLKRLRTDPDAAKLYAWMQTYFGADWVAVQFEGKLNYNIGN